MQRIRFLLCLFALAAICFATTACSDDKPAEKPSGGDKKPADTPPADADKPEEKPKDGGGGASCGGGGKS